MPTSTGLGSISTSSGADDLAIIEVDQNFLVLIPSRFPPIKLYARVANDEEATAAFTVLEDMTNPRLRQKTRLQGVSGPAGPDPPQLQNWNHAPFAYPNPGGSRFFSAATPALELFGDLQTALAVSVRKREAFLSSTGEVPMGLDMRVLTRRVKGRFVDCRAWPTGLEQEERRSRARFILERDVDGLIFSPDERPTATGVAVISGLTLDRAVQGDHFRFAWDGERIGSLYAFRNGVEIDPSVLALPELNRALAA